MKCRQCRQTVATPLATRGVAAPFRGDTTTPTSDTHTTGDTP